MTQAAPTLMVADLRSTEIPYPGSWIDRLIKWISRIPGPSWLFYLVMLLSFALLNNALFWLDGSLAAGTLNPVRLADASFIVFSVALYHHLSLVASLGFKAFRPVLKVPDTDLLILEYRLTTSPRRLGWLAIALGVGSGIAAIQSAPSSFGLDVALTFLPVIYQYAYTIFVASSMLALLFQTVRQLRLVSDLHRRATDIDLFQLEPAHAFSSLTARAAIGLVVLIFVSGLTESSNITILLLVSLVLIGILAIAVFAVPLLGMRDRLRDEKARLLSETNEAIQVTIGRIHDRVHSNEYEDIGGFSTAMSALVVEREIIEDISTWPWEPSTLRGFASTLLIPIFLWLVTRLLERLI